MAGEKSSIALRQAGYWFESKTKAQQRIALFEHLDLEIASGQSYAIVGASGAGKSSLLAIIAGLESPMAGDIHIRIAGKVANALELRRNAGFIFQQFHLLPELDALGNVALPLRLKGDSLAYDKAHDWLDRVGLAARARHRPAQLSGGEQQRLAIARACVTSPTFVFADEPTGNLDEYTADYIAELLFEVVKGQGASLVLVTHSERLSRMAGSRYVLTGGKLRPDRC